MKVAQKVVVTGANGFIGTHLMQMLRSAGFQLYVLVREKSASPMAEEIRVSLADEAALRITLQEIAPEFVIHLAGYTRSGRDLGDFEMHYERNVLPALCVARAMNPSVKLALFFGSIEEYGNGEAPFREDHLTKCFSPYGWSKISAQIAVNLIAHERKFPHTWLRPAITFGPGQNNQLLIPTIIRGCLAGERIPMTLGEQTRDFIYVKDLCQMILNILEEYPKAKDQIINLGTGIPRSIRSVAVQIQSLMGRGYLDFGKLPYRSNEAMNAYLSTEKFSQLFGKTSLTPLKDSLEATIKLN